MSQPQLKRNMELSEPIIPSESKRQCLLVPPVLQPMAIMDMESTYTVSNTVHIPVIDTANVSSGHSSSAPATLPNINNKAVFNGSAMDSQDAIWYDQDQPLRVEPKRRKIDFDISTAASCPTLPTVQPLPPSRSLIRMNSEQAVQQHHNNS